MIVVFSRGSEVGIGVANNEATEIDSGPSRREVLREIRFDAGAERGGRARVEP